MARDCSFAGMPGSIIQWCLNPSDGMVAQAHGKADAIQLAAEVGRLDVLSIAIALFSAAIAGATILGFWFYRNVVDERAKREVGELLPDVVKAHLANNPDVIVAAIRANRDILRAAFASDVEKDFSQEIAETIDDVGSEESNGGKAK